MDAIYEWIKNLVFFYIWITAILHILPKCNYQKYIKFFGGLLLVIILISPILEILHEPEYLVEKISYEKFWQEMDTMQLDVENMETMQKQTYLKAYQEAIGEDISLMLQDEEMIVKKVTVSLTEDYRIENIAMVISWNTQKEIYIEKMVLQDNTSEYPQILELKQKIMEFYDVTDQQIQIMMQEG